MAPKLGYDNPIPYHNEWTYELPAYRILLSV